MLKTVQAYLAHNLSHVVDVRSCLEWAAGIQLWPEWRWPAWCLCPSDCSLRSLLPPASEPERKNKTTKWGIWRINTRSAFSNTHRFQTVHVSLLSIRVQQRHVSVGGGINPGSPHHTQDVLCTFHVTSKVKTVTSLIFELTSRPALVLKSHSPGASMPRH